MTDTKAYKAKNNESGTITQLLSAAEVTTAHLSPVPENAPGVFVMAPGTSSEEHIYYREKDGVLGTVSGLTRDFENQNGGVGREHQANASWETLQSSRHVNNIVDILQEGLQEEMNEVSYVSATSFTVKTNRTSFYTLGRVVRINGSAIAVVDADSTYSAGTGLTTVVVVGTVANPLTKLEFDIKPKSYTDDSATGAEINTGTNKFKKITPKGLADSNVAFLADIPVKASIAENFAGTDDIKYLTSLSNKPLWQFPRGFLLNGKIVPSVTSNNLTVAIKGLDNNNPSATNPVYCRIGDSVRAITSALSITTNAAINWFSSGSTNLAAKEVDYFVYLGYNATDGVVIGFSRIPYATVYTQFSTINTNETYCAISTITNASGGDAYEVIGRFAATLSAGVGYTWSVPTFGNNNLIQRPIYETRWLSFLPAIIGIGGGTVPVFSTYVGFYKRENDTVDMMAALSGDGGTDGSGAYDIGLTTPVGTSTNNGTAYPLGTMAWYGNGVSSGTGFTQRYSATTLQLRSSPTSTITCPIFPNGDRFLYARARYIAL